MNNSGIILDDKTLCDVFVRTIFFVDIISEQGDLYEQSGLDRVHVERH